MNRPSQNHELEPLGLANFFTENFSEFWKKMGKTREGGKIDSSLVFPRLSPFCTLPSILLNYYFIPIAYLMSLSKIICNK